MPFDATANLAIAEIVTPPSPADTGLTLTVLPGQGAYFAMPEFNATIWPKDEIPLPTNTAIVRVRTIVGDVFTFTRDAEPGGTTRAILAGDLIAQTVTKKMLDDIQSGQNFPSVITPGVIRGSNLVWRSSHTWGLVGDVSALTFLPSMFVSVVGTQTVKMVGLKMQISTGTSVSVTLYRNGAAQTGAILVTPVGGVTPLDIPCADGDTLTLGLSLPVGVPTLFSATLFLQHAL